MAENPSTPRAEITTLLRALQYWQDKKLALDAVRPEFTGDQLRELNAAESRLLAIDVSALAALASPVPPPTAPTADLIGLLPQTPRWMVVRKRDAEPNEVYPFGREDDARAFYDKAQQQWSDCFLVAVVMHGVRAAAHVPPASSSAEGIQTLTIETQAPAFMRWYQRGGWLNYGNERDGASNVGDIQAHKAALLHNQIVDVLQQRAEQAEAERDALRTQLQQLAEAVGGPDLPACADEIDTLIEIARDARTASSSAEGIGTWQEIATAPKDGTVIRAYAASLVHEDFNPSGSVEAYWQDDAGWIGALWCDAHDHWTATNISPTHWMPLPDPPVAVEGRREETKP